jgi:hypothetical protein
MDFSAGRKQPCKMLAGIRTGLILEGILNKRALITWFLKLDYWRNACLTVILL